jgi:hypothetical protein
MNDKAGGREEQALINQVYQRLLLRHSRAQICRYLTESGVKERQVNNYIKKARTLLEADLCEDRKSALAEHISTRNQLFQKAYAKGDIKVCLNILDSTAKLQGLFEPFIPLEPTSKPKKATYQMALDLAQTETYNAIEEISRQSKQGNLTAAVALTRIGQSANLQLELLDRLEALEVSNADT